MVEKLEISPQDISRVSAMPEELKKILHNVQRRKITADEAEIECTHYCIINTLKHYQPLREPTPPDVWDRYQEDKREAARSGRRLPETQVRKFFERADIGEYLSARQRVRNVNWGDLWNLKRMRSVLPEIDTTHRAKIHAKITEYEKWFALNAPGR